MFEDIKVVITDIDGSLTDGTYRVSESGEFSKTFYTRDFDALAKLLKNNIKVIIISTSHDDVIHSQIQRICETSSMADLWKAWISNGDLKVINKSGNKKKRLTDMLIDMKLGWWNAAYIGDAENDLECFDIAFYTGCPCDAIDDVKKVAFYKSKFSGGKGAVHDFCNYILSKKEKK